MSSAKDIDELFEQMRLGDLEGAKLMAPIDYAKSRGMYPQKVYSAIRNGKLKPTFCGCGRKVVVVEEADEYFKLGKWQRANEASSAEEEASGGELDT